MRNSTMFALAAALLGCAYGYSGTPLMARARMASPVAGVRPALRPAKSAAVARSHLVLQEATETAPAPDPTCIEDEAVEECVIAEWPAGKLSVRPPRRAGATCALRATRPPPNAGCGVSHPRVRPTRSQMPLKLFDTLKLAFLFTSWFSLNVMCARPCRAHQPPDTRNRGKS